MDVGEQELGLYKAQVMLPFNAFGTMAMAREVSPFFFYFFSFIVYIMSYETYTYLVYCTYKYRSLRMTQDQAKCFGC